MRLHGYAFLYAVPRPDPIPALRTPPGTDLGLATTIWAIFDFIRWRAPGQRRTDAPDAVEAMPARSFGPRSVPRPYRTHMERSPQMAPLRLAFSTMSLEIVEAARWTIAAERDLGDKRAWMRIVTAR